MTKQEYFEKALELERLKSERKENFKKHMALDKKVKNLEIELKPFLVQFIKE